MKSNFIFSAFFIFMISSVSLPSDLHGQQLLHDSCVLNRLPLHIREIIQSKFSLWRILTLNDLSEEDQRFWSRSDKRNQCPGMASGHYESNSAFSFVFSFVPRAGISKGYQLVIFTPDATGLYKDTVLEKSENPSNPLVVYTVPPGIYWNDERNRSISISREGFQSEQKENGAFLFFWERGNINKWKISD